MRKINKLPHCRLYRVSQKWLTFVFADVPHLLKLLRNHFLDDGFVLHDKPLTKDIIQKFLQIAEKMEVKMGHKLTKHHLDVKGSQRQKVKTAAQLMSHTTSKLITYCGGKKLSSILTIRN